MFGGRKKFPTQSEKNSRGSYWNIQIIEIGDENQKKKIGAGGRRNGTKSRRKGRSLLEEKTGRKGTHSLRKRGLRNGGRLKVRGGGGLKMTYRTASHYLQGRGNVGDVASSVAGEGNLEGQGVFRKEENHRKK